MFIKFILIMIAIFTITACGKNKSSENEDSDVNKEKTKDNKKEEAEDDESLKREKKQAKQDKDADDDSDEDTNGDEDVDTDDDETVNTFKEEKPKTDPPIDDEKKIFIYKLKEAMNNFKEKKDIYTIHRYNTEITLAVFGKNAVKADDVEKTNVNKAIKLLGSALNYKKGAVKKVKRRSSHKNDQLRQFKQSIANPNIQDYGCTADLIDKVKSNSFNLEDMKAKELTDTETNYKDIITYTFYKLVIYCDEFNK